MTDIWLYDSLPWNVHIGYIYLPTIQPKKEPKITVDYKLITYFDRIVPNNQYVKIYNGKYPNLVRHCVTLKNIFDSNFK